MKIVPAAIKSLIYIFPYSPTAWDAKKFGFDFFLQSGLDFQVFDLSALISSRVDTGVAYLQGDYIKKIPSYSALEQEIIKTAATAVYIDGINGINGRHIYRLFKKYNVQYYAVEVGSLPILSQPGAKNFLNKIKKIIDFKKLRSYLRWRAGKLLTYWQWKYLSFYQLPAKVFVGNSDLLDHFLNKYRITQSNVVPIHSFDYDRYLAQHRLAEQQPLVEGKFCVFLDQMLATHTDFGKSVSFSPVTASEYLPSLNHFFDQIEKRTGLQVVIAASPRSQYEKTPEIFGHRLVIKDKTLELVAQSSMVLLHTTTAVSFAVLYDKPILLLKTWEMTNAPGYGNLLNNMARALNITPVCIDDTADVAKLDLENYASWQREYDDYKYKYVKTKNVSDKLTWEILMAQL
jgi:hypothetical protein